MAGSLYSLTLALVFFAQSLNAVPATPVVTESNAWPPRGSAWVGDQPHRFLGGQVVLFCGSHGVFSTRVKLSSSTGQISNVQYGAGFRGEPTINPPLQTRSMTYVINEPIRISERMTSVASTRLGTEYETELTGLGFDRNAFPGKLLIRESQRRRSTGHTSIRREGSGNYRILSHYEVWLEISVDGGHSWQLADNAVRMRLQPEVRAATINAGHQEK